MGYRVKKSELKTAKDLGGYRQIKSGSLPGVANKGDVRILGKYRIEQKDPMQPYHTLRYNALQSLWKIATSTGELPIYFIKYPPFSLYVVPEGLIEGTQCIDTWTLNKTKRFNIIEINTSISGEEHIRMITKDRTYMVVREGLCQL